MEPVTIKSKLETSLPLVSGEKQLQPGNDMSFGRELTGAINKVGQLRNEADAAVSELASGHQKDLHQTMIAMEKADVSFRLMMQVRNKIIKAYEEVMRMPV